MPIKSQHRTSKEKVAVDWDSDIIPFKFKAKKTIIKKERYPIATRVKRFK